MPVTIDEMTAEVEAPSERNTAAEEAADDGKPPKADMVRAVMAREAARAARVWAD